MLRSRHALTSIIFGFITTLASAQVDVPGGQTRTAAAMPSRTYELLVGPSYMFSARGATYLTSKVRYQALESLNVGFGFGSGEVGFNFGAEAFLEIFPQTSSQPAFGVLTAGHFNRIVPNNYFVLRVAPIVSYEILAPFGAFNPYGGLHFAPSLALGNAPNLVAAKLSGGAEFRFKALDGLKVWTEVGLGIAQSASEIVMGISYPFAAL